MLYQVLVISFSFLDIIEIQKFLSIQTKIVNALSDLPIVISIVAIILVVELIKHCQSQLFLSLFETLNTAILRNQNYFLRSEC